MLHYLVLYILTYIGQFKKLLIYYNCNNHILGTTSTIWTWKCRGSDVNDESDFISLNDLSVCVAADDGNSSSNEHSPPKISLLLDFTGAGST